MKELWKDIEGYEGLYQISNTGKVKSLDRCVKTKKGQRIKKGKLMSVLFYNGYSQIKLRYLGKNKTFTVHRLVAQHFFKDFNSDFVIGFKDGNPKNCRLDNLYISDKINPLSTNLNYIKEELEYETIRKTFKMKIDVEELFRIHQIINEVDENI